MVTLSNVATYHAVKSGELTYRLSDGSIGEFIETGALGLSIGRVLDERYNQDLEKELWEEGPGYPVAPYETVVIESEEIVGTRNMELEPSLNSSLARMGMRLCSVSIIEPRAKPEKVRAVLQNGPIGVYITKELPYVKLRPHKLDEEKYMSVEEVLESAKRGAITLWSDKQIDFGRYPTLKQLIKAYKKGDPWRPEKPLELSEYLDLKNGCLNLPLNTKGVLRIEPKSWAKDKYVILNKNLKPFRCGICDFILEAPDAEGRLKIMKGEHYLVNTTVLLGLHGVVGEILESSEISGLRMHSTSKFLDSGNINAPVCELFSDETISVSPKNTVSIEFEKVDGIITDNHKDSVFSFQRFPRLPKCYDDSDLLLPLLAWRHGTKSHPQEKEIYKWILRQLSLPYLARYRGHLEKLFGYEKNYEIASRMLDDIFPKRLHTHSDEDTIKFLKTLINTI